jgi:alkylated DNA repair dioxygenase AlkB
MLLCAGQTRLDPDGLVRYEPAWLAADEADAMLHELRSQVAWEQGTITMFGRQVQEPRLTAWFGEADYTYSGRTVRAAPWPASLAALRDRVDGAAGARFNGALLNLYRDGNDSMGLHSDDEPDLGTRPIIASVSLGAERRFVLVPKRAARDRTVEVTLGHGSLLVMAGACQHNYRHGVPKRPASCGERINLTFRTVLGALA